MELAGVDAEVRPEAGGIPSNLSVMLGSASLACGLVWILPVGIPMCAPLAVVVLGLGILIGALGILASLLRWRTLGGQRGMTVSLFGTGLCLGWVLFWIGFRWAVLFLWELL